MWTHTSNGSMAVQHVRTERCPLVRGAIAIFGTRVALVPTVWRREIPKRIKKVIGYQHTTTLTTHVGEPPVMEAWEPSSISPKTASQWATPTLTSPSPLVAHVPAPPPFPFPSQSTHLLVAPSAPVASPPSPPLTLVRSLQRIRPTWKLLVCCANDQIVMSSSIFVTCFNFRNSVVQQCARPVFQFRFFGDECIQKPNTVSTV